MAGILRSVRSEFERLGSARTRAVAALVALAVPLVACAVLLGAFGGVLDRSSQLPVAVVNLDAGATDSDGHEVQAGADLVDSLMETEQVSWQPVDADAAQRGLEDGTYALAVEIPENYSERVASVSGDEPDKAELRVVSAGSTNLLATTWGTDVLRQVQSRLKSDLGEDYLLSLLNDVKGQASRLSLTADGAVMLEQGYDALSQGAGAVTQGLDAIAGATPALSQGLGQIGSGVRAVGEGTGAVGEGLAAAGQGLDPLAQGAAAASTGLGQLEQVTSELGDTAGELAAELMGMSVQLAQASGTLAGSGIEGASEQAGTLARALADKRTALAQERAAVDAAIGQVSGVDEAAGKVSGLAGSAQGLAASLGKAEASIADGAPAEKGLSGKADDLAAQLEALGERADESGEITLTVEELQALKVQAQGIADHAVAASEEASGLSTAASEADGSLAGAAEGVSGLAGALDAYEAAADGLDAAADSLNEHVSGVLLPSFSGAGEAVSSVQDVAARLSIVSGAAPAGALAAEGAPVSGAQGSTPGERALALALSLPQVSSAIGQSAQGTGALAQGIGMASSGLEPAAAGLDALAQGGIALADALDGVGAGVDGLGTGLSALAQGNAAISGGISQLGEGSSQMFESVATAADELSGAAAAPDEQAEVAASPVSLTTVRTGGEGSFVPLALAVALWAGALGTALLVEPVSRRMAFSGLGALSCVLSGALPYLAFGVVQAAVLGGGAVLALGLSVSHPLGFAALLALGAVAFALVAQALVLWLGRAGAAVASCAWLGLMLAAGGGVLPGVLSEPVFQALGALSPVGQLAHALAYASAGVGLAPAAGSALALAIFSAGALGASALAVHRMRVVRPERAFAQVR